LEGLGLIAIRHALERDEQPAPVEPRVGHDELALPVFTGQQP
jgi:hypothetical protein